MREFTQDHVDFYIDKFFKEYLLKVSDRQVDEIAKNMVRKFLSEESKHNPKDMWNFTKELLDICVQGSLCSSFEIVAMDFETAGYCPPEGTYCEADGSINESPWRKAVSWD
ncbi:MAG: hypothetical protein DWQ19_11260 [Crenarchaeota archaeon]|nr:MAG: hypothetical protein DWQ19_11260 [Thermoproteota archaeon]